MVQDRHGDGNGGWVVVEQWSPPRRTAHFDSDGEIIEEWYGGQRFFTDVAVDPKDPSLVWLTSYFGSLIEAQVLNADFSHEAFRS